MNPKLVNGLVFKFGMLQCPVLAIIARSDQPSSTSAVGSKADNIGGIRGERRIEIDQASALGRDAVAEHR